MKSKTVFLSFLILFLFTSTAFAAIKQLTFFGTPAIESWFQSLTADGKFLYFVSSRDLVGANPSLSPQIFRVDIPNGTTAQISSFTDGLYTGQMRVSGNGSRLVFVRNPVNIIPYVSSTETYVMNTDGTGLLKVSHPTYMTSDPVISYDGGKIAYLAYIYADGNWPTSIYVVNSDGTDRREVYSSYMGYLLSEDGSRIIMETNSYPLHRYLMNSDGSGLREILYDEEGAKYGVTLSFDGTYSLFVSTHDYGENSAHTQNLFRMKNDGSEITQITHAPDFPCEGGLYCAPFSNLLSADGQKVVYAQLWKLTSQGGGLNTLVRRNADGTNTTNLLDLPQTDFGGDLLAINQDASVVIFASQDDYTSQNPNHNREFFAYMDDGLFVPNIAVSPVSHDFGNVEVDSCSAPQTFTLQNTGNADLQISDITLSDTNFQLDMNGGLFPCTFNNLIYKPGESCTVTVSFCPSKQAEPLA